MPSLSQSPILQALGYAIAHSLWQMAMVWIVYVLLNSLFKFKSEIKYRIAVAAQVVGFAWFIGTLQFYYTQCSQALRMAEAVYLESGDQASVVYTSKSSLLSFFIKAEQVLPYLSVAYLLLLAFLVIRWCRAYRYTQIVRLNGLHKMDIDWKLFVTKVAAQLGIKQKVRIYLSELVQSPVTIGFLKPVILVPIASINHLTAQQMEAVILHELAHIKRHDYLLNIALSIIELGLFFNPFTRLINKSISKERENSCDDWVLQYQYNPAMYAEALLRIAVLQKTPAMAMYAVKTKSEPASRVQRMVGQKDGRFSYRHQLIALLLMTGILASIAWYDPNSMKERDFKPTAENTAVVLEPLAVKVDNPLFNPVFFLNEPLKAEVKKNVEATQRQLSKLRSKSELATREIVLPQVMAPVAIENLKDLERNLNSTVAKQMKKTWFTTATPANVTQTQGQAFYTGTPATLFQFDTLRFNNTYSFGFNDANWGNLNEELKTSQKEVEDLLKKGKITSMDAKKMQADIQEAFNRLKELKLPQFYSFAPTITAEADGNVRFYLKSADNKDNEEMQARERARVDEKRRIVQGEKMASRIKKVMTDSLKKRILARTVPVTPGTPAQNGYVIAEGQTPYLVVDGKLATYVPAGTTLKPSHLRAATLPVGTTTGKSSDVTGDALAYAYVLRDEMNGEECDKANNTDRKHKKTCTAGSVKVTTTVVNGGCTKTTTTKKTTQPPTPPKQETTETIIISVE